MVKTLFVTSFTTKGRVREGQPIKRGYTYRPTCVPTWVTNAKAADMTDTELDAFTGATPKESGKQTFIWDFTDSKGQKVAKRRHPFHQGQGWCHRNERNRRAYSSHMLSAIMLSAINR